MTPELKRLEFRAMRRPQFQAGATTDKFEEDGRARNATSSRGRWVVLATSKGMSSFFGPFVGTRIALASIPRASMRYGWAGSTSSGRAIAFGGIHVHLSSIAELGGLNDSETGT